MVTLKCKMCGGTLSVQDGSSVAVCEYCDTKQTVPRIDGEKKAVLFERANSCRSASEFDRAAAIYESILSDDPNEAEAYWGLCLCKYGIEYVTDPQSGKKIPTCHRTQFKSILDDNDYASAVGKSDVIAAQVYREEAQYIDRVQKEILALSAKEDPYDVFICYKETDFEGHITQDSSIARDIYDELKEQGYRVFFSKITLRGKLGSAYEPHIFAALNSAKVMLVIGTNPDYFNAVWVKNEWSRYLSMIHQGQDKHLIVCYRDMNPERDFPSELVALQASNLGDIGFMKNLTQYLSENIKQQKKSQGQITGISPARTNAPQESIISYIQCRGAVNSDDMWPKTPVSSVINKDEYSTIRFHLMFKRPIGYNGDIKTGFTIYDSMGNIVLDDTSNIAMRADYDRISKGWVLRGQDGTSVSDGDYKAVFKINDTAPVECKFRVVSSGSNMYGNVPAETSTNTRPRVVSNEAPYSTAPVTYGNKSFGLYLVLCILLGYLGIHKFYAGKKGAGIVRLILAFTPLSLISTFLWIIDIIKAIFTRRIS